MHACMFSIAWSALASSSFHHAAHKLYPVRIRVVNLVTNAPQWVTIAYVPIVKKLIETAANERAKLRRSAVLQRVLYMALRSVINASHSCVTISTKDGTSLTAYPRLLLNIFDQPEERAVLGLKGGQCARPCTACMAKIEMIGAPQALDADERNVINTVTNQVEAYEHTRRQRERHRRVALGALDSASGGVPGLAGMAGLGTAPLLLYKMIGFDVLHVRSLFPCPLGICLAAVRTSCIPLANALVFNCEPRSPALLSLCFPSLVRFLLLCICCR